MAHFKVLPDGKVSYPAFVEDKKKDCFVSTTIELNGRTCPNPDAIALLRPSSKLRQFLENWAAREGK